eukprot:g28444.t1
MGWWGLASFEIHRLWRLEVIQLLVGTMARAGQRGLPKGAGFIILNCFLYSATYRLDAAAVGVSSSLCLFAYCRLIMAAMCFSSTRLWKRGREGDSTGLWEPRALLLLIFVCVVDAAYMLSMYQAPGSVQEIFRIIHELADALQKQLIPGENDERAANGEAASKDQQWPLPSMLACVALLSAVAVLASESDQAAFEAFVEKYGRGYVRGSASYLERFKLFQSRADEAKRRRAVSLISPVLVSAVKRGGGIVVSALFGAIFFNEKLEGRSWKRGRS